MSAYACNPYQGSESGVGWGWVNAIAKRHQVWAIVGEVQKNDIEREVSANPQNYQNIKFYYVPRIRWLRLEKVWPPAYLWTYRLWQREAFDLGSKLHQEIAFDLVHLITYVGFRVPGHFWKMDIPFVWGPIGGLENIPWRFMPMLGLRGGFYYVCRNILNSLHKRVLIEPKQAFRKAGRGTIAATEGIRREILKWYGQDSTVICEIGAPAEVVNIPAVREPGAPLKLSWSGLHLPGKALPLLLRALAMMPRELNWELDVLGKGPCSDRWHRLARKLGIDSKCRWHGELPRPDAIRLVGQSNVFVITSIKDLTSTVLLEALSQGVPVICPDHCGFSDVVTSSCGITLPLVDPRQLVCDMSHVIMWLAGEERERLRLASGALRRIKDFSWEKKAELIDSIYKSVLEAQPNALMRRNLTADVFLT